MMSKKHLHQSAANEAPPELVVVLSNSKYSYAQFKSFHQTVLGLLEYSDLAFLSAAQKKNLLFFIGRLVQILEMPSHSCAGCSNTTAILPVYPAQDKPVELNYAKADLEKLLNWVDSLVVKKHITMEAMLDQFFALELEINTMRK